jgi:hypothetical protein
MPQVAAVTTAGSTQGFALFNKQAEAINSRSASE